MPGVQNMSLTNPYSMEAAEIERRRKLYEALQQQSMEPIQQQPTPAGGFAVPIAPTQGLAKIAQALAAAYGQYKTGESEKALGERKNKAVTEALNDMPQPRQETTYSPFDMASVGQDMPGEAPIAGLTNEQTRTVQPTMRDNASWLGRLSQIDPAATAIGSSMLTMKQKEDENALNRQSKTMDRIMQLDAIAANAALSREERAARASEAATLRRDLAADSDKRAREMQTSQQTFLAQQRREGAADRRANMPVQPLVQVMGPNNTPTWVERKDAIGKVPAGAGSKAEQVIAGKAEVDSSVITLKSALDQLSEGGGITSTEKGVISNIGSWAANTPVGQTMGSMGRTTNQKARDVISQARPLLLRSIMQATGMSARSLDSNAELKLWLSTATDPTKGYEANIEALNNIAEKYGSGGFLRKGEIKPIRGPDQNKPFGSGAVNPHAGKSDEQIRKELGL